MDEEKTFLASSIGEDDLFVCVCVCGGGGGGGGK